MAHTMIEKIIGKNIGQEVRPGEIVTVRVDRVMIHDIFIPFVAEKFAEMGFDRIWNPDKVVLIYDHLVPASQVDDTRHFRVGDEFAEKYGLTHVHRSDGICHQLMPEAGYVKPGDVVFGTDSHTTTYGCVGAFSTGIGYTEMAGILGTGELWVRVPETIRITINGTLPENVTSKDVILTIIGDLGADGATYQALEFAGDTVENMSIASRMTMSNMAVEAGAKCGLFAPDEKTADFCGIVSSGEAVGPEGAGATPEESAEGLYADEGAAYARELRYRAEDFVPVLACPSQVDNIQPVSQWEGTKIDQVFLGSCTNGRLEDLQMAAAILKDKHVAPFVNFIVTPASRKVYEDAIADGTMDRLVKAGAQVTHPGCGLCCGRTGGILTDGERVVATNNRNFLGRMGTPGVEIFLASPKTAAASALAGKITSMSKEVLYKNTRDASEVVTASQAILNGLAGHGGLYVPTEIPPLPVSLLELAGMSYSETAYTVMSQFLTDFTEDELRHCIARAYDEKFDTPEIAPLVWADDTYYLELFHGATAAFKDLALSILPHLMTTAAKKNHITNEVVILTATSGDTGKAALAGFANVPGTKIIVFYPKDGVSPIQERQMVTQQGDNTLVVGIRGNFDEAQTGVKRMFSDPGLNDDLHAAGYQFSSANSINIGRLVPQIVYYVYAWARLFERGEIAQDDAINVVVPTGNFGNILAAYYAREMGVPIARLICASNENKVLYDFFATGTYDRNREFILTSSPSMDILISSNLERLIYRITGEDAEANAALMKQLTETGTYEITPKMREQLAVFYGNFADEAECADSIRTLYREEGYVIDPHTAVAAAVCKKYREETGDSAVTVLASTASPFKFTRSVLRAIEMDQADSPGGSVSGAKDGTREETASEAGEDACGNDAAADMAMVDRLAALTGLSVPRPIEELRDATAVYDVVCDVDEMESVVRSFLHVKH